MKTDAVIARLEARLYAGEKVLPTEFAGIEPEARGERGSGNMKAEAAGALWAWMALMAPKRMALADVRQHLVDLLNHQLTVGIWSVPGPHGPVSEAMSVSHGKHWLRFLAFVTWAAWRVDLEILGLCVLLWRQLAAYYTLTCVEGTVYTVGPRAFGLGKPGPKNPTGRAGTDSVHDEMGRLWTAPSTCRERMWKGDDFLSLRIMRELVGKGVVERPTFPDGITSEDLPRTCDPIAIWRMTTGVLVRLLSCADTTKPGPQWAAMASLDGYQRFEVEPALVDLKNGFGHRLEPEFVDTTHAILTRRPA